MQYFAYLCGFVKNGEAVACNENCSAATAALAIRRRVLRLTRALAWEVGKLEHAIVRGDSEDNSPFSRIVAERPRRNVGATKGADVQQSNVRTAAHVVRPDLLIPHVEDVVPVDCKRRPFALEFEYDETIVVTCGHVL